ncbi:hypothetical protein, partial [Evtepia gabavorous]|uniref:hypothetical protein n=1 Tax=Evtepia gabavorous TaxID=2211183 RepID=UPI002FDD28A5
SRGIRSFGGVVKKERDFGIASGKKTIGLSWRGSGASKGGAPCSRALVGRNLWVENVFIKIGHCLYREQDNSV